MNARTWMAGAGEAICWCLLACGCAVTPLTAQGTMIVPGEVTERAVSPSDPTQSYAVYLPSTYANDRRWPVLFLLDPRGRALLPLQLFRPAAEANGWILISSYNSVSDGPPEPNVVAVNAMLNDARASFSIDRVYIGGFSGTARLAWEFAAQIPEAAGIFGAGAGLNLSESIQPNPPARVPFFGAAGVLDFNHDEMIRFETRLDAWELPHRMRVFEGVHQWPPEEIASEAVDWFELRAMREGRLAVDTARLAAWYTRDSTAIASLRQSGRGAVALERAREVLADYRGLGDTVMVARTIGELSRDREVRAYLAKQDELLDDNAVRHIRLFEYLNRVREMSRPPRFDDSMRQLDIESLQRRVAGKDTARALSAGRALEQIFVLVSFYAPREFLDQGDAERALAMLEIAEAIHPGRPRVLLNRARSFALLGRLDEARAALDQAMRAGVAPEMIRADSLLSRIVR